MISSRMLLFVLIGLNLVVALWLVGLLPVATGSERDPDRLINQIEPSKLELVRPAANDGTDSAVLPPGSKSRSGRKASALATVAARSTAMPTGANAGGFPGLAVAASELAKSAGLSVDMLSGQGLPSLSPTPVSLTQVKTLGPTDSLASIQSATLIGNCVLFPQSDYLEARKQIEQFVPSLARARLLRLDGGSYRVFIEPLANLQAAEKRRQELIVAGMTNARVIPSGAFRNGVSLGLLRTASMAARRLQDVRKLGVDLAMIGPQVVEVSRYRLEMQADAVLIEQSVRPAAQREGLELEPC